MNEKAKQEFIVMAVPGPAFVIAPDKLDEFLAIKPNLELTAAARERVKRFNQICKVRSIDEVGR